MRIEVLKKSVERFRQVVDFGQVLPPDVEVEACIARVRDAATGESVDGPVEVGSAEACGRVVKVMLAGGEPGRDYLAELVCTLSDGQVVVQDVLVRVESDREPFAKAPPAWAFDANVWGEAVKRARAAGEKSIGDVTRHYYELGGKVRRPDGSAEERAPEQVRKDGDKPRGYAGEYVRPHAAVGAQARQARAYGRDESDRRKSMARAQGLPVATCPECEDGGEPAEVDLSEVALGKNALTRGKLLKVSRLMAGGVRPAGGDVKPIRVVALSRDEAKRVGKKYAVVPGDGTHRVAHLMLSTKGGRVPVVVAERKQLSTETAGKGKELVPTAMGGTKRRRRLTDRPTGK